jgi:sarcosine oxidase gamma subunit
MGAEAPDLEFVAYAYPPAGGEGVLPLAPGASNGQLLHVAPGRWFAPAAGAAVRDALNALTEVGSLIEVQGKWSRFDLTGPEAAAVLSETIDVAAVLSGRECAAVLLFDCPSILARAEGGFAVWTRASHRPHLAAELTRLTGR